MANEPATPTRPAAVTATGTRLAAKRVVDAAVLPRR